MNIFVTGTDTSVGKTVVSAALCLKLGWKYWKPVQSGTTSETDSDWIKKILEPSRARPETYRLRNPLSPHIAAAMDGIEINVDTILKVAKTIDETVVEGAGGLLVPVNANFLLIDVIKEMNIPVILVTRSSLGTINHTLLSIEAIRQRHIGLLGIIMVGDQNSENRESIESYGRVEVLGEIPIFKILDRSALKSVCKTINLKERLHEYSRHA